VKTMSKLEEIEITMEEGFKPQVNISPSSINTWRKCPRQYYYNYIEKIKTKPSIHLIKGSIIHKVLEDLFRQYDEDLEKRYKELLDKQWVVYDQRLKDLELPDGQLKAEYEDCLEILNEFYISLSRKMNALVKREKAEDRRHAFYLLKPKLKEKYVKDEELHCVGYIDRIHKDFDGVITLGDYKTSSKYGIGLSSDYKTQLAIYALLYEKQEKIMPDFCSVIFLRYGEEYFVEVTPSLLRYARDTIIDVYNKTRSVNKEDYPLKEQRLCAYCDYKDRCSGKEEHDRNSSLERLKQTLKKKDSKD
jgi:putative RecB family exonuclease